MNPRSILALTAASLLAPSAVAQRAATPNSGAWSGVIVYSSCNADEAFAESPECFRAAPGARLALYDDTNRVESLDLLSIGLAVGQKAPPFSLRDQAGRRETLETLKGANGTVLLFFRSADW